jgi:quinol monooxygenase YgiN
MGFGSRGGVCRGAGGGHSPAREETGVRTPPVDGICVLVARSVCGPEPGQRTVHCGSVPDLPWTSPSGFDPEQTYVVMASHLPLAGLASTVKFLRAVSAVRRQLAGAEGLVGYTLRAKPLARDYWTLSVWKDEAALHQFMRTAPHAELMGSLKPITGPTKFVQWQIAGTEGRPAWSAALERLTSR